MSKTYNTYICISIVSHPAEPRLNSGRIYTCNESAKLDLHLDVSYDQAKKELAKLMLRIGKMPNVVGKDDGAGAIMYMLDAFLD